jgi:hypothetical protein
MTSLDFTELGQEDDNEVSPMDVDVEVTSQQNIKSHIRPSASLRKAMRNITNQLLNKSAHTQKIPKKERLRS